jgi:DNA repair protein RadD
VKLRPYQHAAIDAVYQHLRDRDDNPVVVCPTGSGKSVLIAQIANDAVTRWNGRVLVLAHVQELLEQNADKIRRLCSDVKVGIYSAGLKKRDTESSVICAGIQSVYRRACELDAFDLVIVDEAHLITTEGDGMYRQFLSDALVINPHLRVIGMTATPFRLKSGLICSPDHFLNHVCYEIGIRELIRDGYLCPLVSKAGKSKAHTENVSVRGGEFVAGELESLMNRDSLVEAACREIVERTADRQSCLIFASGVEHGKHIARILREKHNAECGFVCGETPASEREELLARFRGDSSGTLFGREPLKYLCNVNVLTTGFDAPNIDCIALLRPTMSPGLLVQMVGRGLRQHPDKQDCQILDFGGNIERHGPIDQIKVKEKPGEGGPAPAKECPECNSVIAAGYAVCPDCGYEFPPPDRNPHESEASSASVLSGEITNTVYEVQDVTYYVHTKRGADEDAPKTMRVEYQVGFNEFVSEWVCFEHTGFARRKAEAWWRKRSPDPVPPTAERAVELAEAGALADTHSITVRSVAGEPYDRVVDYELGELPEPVGVDNYDSFGGVDDIPF